MKTSAIIINLVAVLFLVGGVSAQQPTSAPAVPVASAVVTNGNGASAMMPMNTPGWAYGPGDYNMVTMDGQQVMRTYEIVADPDKRGNFAAAFRHLLKNDGGRCGTAEVALVERGDKKIILLTVVATERMQESIAQTIEKINSGKIVGYFNYQPETVKFTPQFRSAQAIHDLLKPEMTNVGLLYVDVGLNALTIEDDPSYLPWLVEFAKEFDQPTPRVNATVTVVEFESSNDENVGLDWYAWWDAMPVSVSASLGGERFPLNRSRSLELGDGVGKLVAGTSNDRLSALGLSNFAVAVDGISPQALAGFVNYLSMRGRCKVVTTANVAVINGSPSIVSTETVVPTPVTATNDVGGKVRTETQAMEGFTLTINGVIALAGPKLAVRASCSSIVGYSRTGMPITSHSNLETTVGVCPDKTVVLSGLTRQKEITQNEGPAWDILHLLGKQVTVKHQSRLYVCIAAEDGKPTDLSADEARVKVAEQLHGASPK